MTLVPEVPDAPEPTGTDEGVGVDPPCGSLRNPRPIGFEPWNVSGFQRGRSDTLVPSGAGRLPRLLWAAGDLDTDAQVGGDLRVSPEQLAGQGVLLVRRG